MTIWPALVINASSIDTRKDQIGMFLANHYHPTLKNVPISPKGTSLTNETEPKTRQWQACCGTIPKGQFSGHSFFVLLLGIMNPESQQPKEYLPEPLTNRFHVSSFNKNWRSFKARDVLCCGLLEDPRKAQKNDTFFFGPNRCPMTPPESFRRGWTIKKKRRKPKFSICAVMCYTSCVL